MKEVGHWSEPWGFIAQVNFKFTLFPVPLTNEESYTHNPAAMEPDTAMCYSP